MTESRAKRMKTVLSLAEKREQAAARLLGEWRKQLATEQAQLQQLVEYRDHYQQVYANRSQVSRASDLITYSSFLQRLIAACKDQEQKISLVQRQYDISLQAWQQSYHRRQSLAQMIERLQNEELLQLEKRLQKELDEQATQRFIRGQWQD
jgi:flagellar FliJ protein